MTEAEYRALKKKHHICPHCGKQDAYTLAGRTLCAECAERERVRKETSRKAPEARKKENEYAKAERARRRAANLCLYCGKRPAAQGHTMCGVCLAKQRRYKNRRDREKGRRMWDERTNGTGCFMCGEPCVEGKKLCEKHMIQRIENLRKSNPDFAYLPTEEYLRKGVSA